MKAKAVSALREERGLHRVSGAEPQVVGLAPQTTSMTERTNTMKTYILRDPQTVEPQTPLAPVHERRFRPERHRGGDLWAARAAALTRAGRALDRGLGKPVEVPGAGAQGSGRSTESILILSG